MFAIVVRLLIIFDSVTAIDLESSGQFHGLIHNKLLSVPRIDCGSIAALLMDTLDENCPNDPLSSIKRQLRSNDV